MSGKKKTFSPELLSSLSNKSKYSGSSVSDKTLSSKVGTEKTFDPTALANLGATSKYAGTAPKAAAPITQPVSTQKPKTPATPADVAGFHGVSSKKTTDPLALLREANEAEKEAQKVKKSNRAAFTTDEDDYTPARDVRIQQNQERDPVYEAYDAQTVADYDSLMFTAAYKRFQAAQSVYISDPTEENRKLLQEAAAKAGVKASKHEASTGAYDAAKTRMFAEGEDSVAAAKQKAADSRQDRIAKNAGLKYRTEGVSSAEAQRIKSEAAQAITTEKQDATAARLKEGAYKDVAFTADYRNWMGVQGKNDFATKSKYTPTRVSNEKAKTHWSYDEGIYSADIEASAFRDAHYDAINGDADALNEVRFGNFFSLDDKYSYADLYEQMTPDEVAVYNYYYRANKTKAQEWIDFLTPTLVARSKNDTTQQLKAAQERNPFLMTVANTISSTLAQPAAALNQNISNLAGTVTGDVDPRSGRLYDVAMDPRNVTSQYIAEKGGKWGSLGYGVATSILDQGLARVMSAGLLGDTAAAGKLVQTLMSSNAMASTTEEALNRGLSLDQATTLGLLSGFIEYATEKYSVGAWLDKTTLDKSVGGYILKNALSEGLEEGASNLANIAADILVSQDSNKWKQDMRDLRAKNPGMTEEEAFQKAFLQRAEELGFDMLAGFVSGGAMGTVQAAPAIPGAVSDSARMAKLKRTGALYYPGAQDGAILFDPETGMIRSRSVPAQPIDIADSPKYTDTKAKDGTTVLSEAATAFVNAGMRADTAQKKAEVVRKLVAGEEVSELEINTLEPTNPKRRALFSELTGVQFPEGKLSPKQLYDLYRSAAQVAQTQVTETVAEMPAEEAHISPESDVQQTPTTDIPAAETSDTEEVSESVLNRMREANEDLNPEFQDREADVQENLRNVVAALDMDKDGNRLATQAEFLESAKDYFPDMTERQLKSEYKKYRNGSRTVLFNGERMTRTEFGEMLRSELWDENLTNEQVDTLFNLAVLSTLDGVDAYDAFTLTEAELETKEAGAEKPASPRERTSRNQLTLSNGSTITRDEFVRFMQSEINSDRTETDLNGLFDALLTQADKGKFIDYVPAMGKYTGESSGSKKPLDKADKDVVQSDKESKSKTGQPLYLAGGLDTETAVHNNKNELEVTNDAAETLDAGETGAASEGNGAVQRRAVGNGHSAQRNAPYGSQEHVGGVQKKERQGKTGQVNTKTEGRAAADNAEASPSFNNWSEAFWFFENDGGKSRFSFGDPPMPGIDEMTFGRLDDKGKWQATKSYPLTPDGLKQFNRDLPGFLQQGRGGQADTRTVRQKQRDEYTVRVALAEKDAKLIDGPDGQKLKAVPRQLFTKGMRQAEQIVARVGSILHYVYGRPTEGAAGLTIPGSFDVFMQGDGHEDAVKGGKHEGFHATVLRDPKLLVDTLDAIEDAGFSEVLSEAWARCDEVWAERYAQVSSELLYQWLVDNEVLAELFSGNLSRFKGIPGVKALAAVVQKTYDAWAEQWDAAEHDLSQPAQELSLAGLAELYGDRLDGQYAWLLEGNDDFELTDESEDLYGDYDYVDADTPHFSMALVPDMSQEERVAFEQMVLRTAREAYGDMSPEQMQRRVESAEHRAQLAEESRIAAETKAREDKRRNTLAWTIFHGEKIRQANRSAQARVKALQAKAKADKNDALAYAKAVSDAELAVARDEKTKALQDKDLAWTIFHKKRLREAKQTDRQKLNDVATAMQQDFDETLARQKETAAAEAKVQHEGDMMAMKRLAAKRLRTKEDAYRSKIEGMRENKKLHRSAARRALLDKKQVAKKRAIIETAQGPVSTIRQNPKARSFMEWRQDAAKKLRTLGRTAYFNFVNTAEAIDRFAKRQVSDTRAGTLVTVLGGVNTTVEYVFKKGLCNAAGDRIGDSMSEVFLCWDAKGKHVDEDKQALLQDYMLHLHNQDRMGFVAKAEANLAAFEAENPWLAEMDTKEFALLVAMTDKEVQKTGKQEAQKLALEYAELLDVRNRAQDKAIFADEKGKSVTAKTSREICEKYLQENPWLAEKAQGIYDWWNTFMETYVVGTSVSAADYALMKSIYPHYVPTYRADKGGVGGPNFVGMNGASVTKAIKRAKGSHAQVVNIEDSFANLVSKYIRQYRTNELYANILDTLMLDEDGTFEDFGVFDWESMRQGQSYLAADGQEVSRFADGYDTADHAEQAERTALVKTKDGYKLSAWYNGQLLSAHISEELYRAVAATTGNLANDFEKLLLKVGNTLTGPMKTAITGINPSFAVRNVSRDLPTAITNSISGVAFPKYWARAAVEIAKNSDHWQRFQALGGTHSGYYNNNAGFTKAMAKKSGAIDKMGAFNERTEAQTRFAEYLATIDRLGDTSEGRLRGIKNAAEVTVDFSRSGRIGKVINAWVPYWNPAVQGIDKVVRSVIESPDGKAIWKQAGKTLGRAALTTVLLEGILYAVLKAVGRYDEWEELDDRTKDTYYCIPLKDENKFLKIPKSREWGAILGTPVMRILEGFNGRENPFENYVETSLEANFLPPALLRLTLTDEGTRLDSDVIGVSQALDLARNEDFAGRAIIPYAYQEGSPSQQFDADTSYFSRALGDMFNFSPMAADYIISDYFGDFGDVFTMATAEATWNGDQNIAQGVLEIVKNPWVKDNRYSSQDVSDYYETMEALDRVVVDKRNQLGLEAYKDTVEYQTQKAMNTLFGDAITELSKTAGELPDGEEKDGVKAEIKQLTTAALAYYDQCMSGEITKPALDAEYHSLSPIVSNELIRLDSFAKDYKFTPTGRPSSSYTDPRRKNYEYILTDEQKEYFTELYWQVYDEIYSALIESGRYRNAKDERKVVLLEDARADVLEETKELFFDWLRDSGVRSTKKAKK